jgi:hypothetical protein
MHQRTKRATPKKTQWLANAKRQIYVTNYNDSLPFQFQHIFPEYFPATNKAQI